MPSAVQSVYLLIVAKESNPETMDDSQHFVDLQENSNFGDHKSWLSGDDNFSPALRRVQSQLSALTSTPASITGASGNVDRVLFDNLVDLFPLVESLIHRKANCSFTRRGSMIYTKMRSRESLCNRIIDPKERNTIQSIPAKKKREQGDKHPGKNAGNNQDADNFSSRASATEKDIKELVALREQVEDLQRKLLEKDGLLKSAEISKNQMNVVHSELDELKQQAAEKDSIIKSTQLQLSDAKIKLADKQAALEKIQWEAMTSNRKADELLEDLDALHGGISTFMMLFEGLTNNDFTTNFEDYDVKPHYVDNLPDIDDFDDGEMQKMVEASQAYVVAVAAAKEKQDEESLAAAASARLRLQSFVFRSSSMNAAKGRRP
ncbi:protein MICROTUBULE BINDING PROTEIN 2C isoform X2 [Manihot esculenta]|uniref:Uncharacterized protein n=1 Tax=Manihot esculenta TaxID=3983 RepID=A0A2C9UK73_MANES|nr:protein MICROTUBULE BINDING PROTEIN 2C isoform X2 [Manihot esculenta]OAY31160.1 hypothetical protein MANES_14G089100v8 [Manihot esculenta]